ncbi:MAG: START domain-containing protein [Chitinophagales bacterium]
MLRISMFLFFIYISPSMLYAQQEWTLKEEEAGIKVYSRHGDSKNNEIKVELTISAKLSDVAAVLLDIPNYSEWSYNCQRSYVLKQLTQNDIYFYNEVKTVWPASDRDVVARMKITQDSATKIMKVHTMSDPHFIPEKKDLVRVPFSDETWTVTPLYDERVKIVYFLQIDPGGAAPAWLINLFSTKAPFESFKKFSIQVQNPKYRQTIIVFIRN